MAFAGIEREQSYASSLGEGLGVAPRWPEECEARELVRGNERREKKRKNVGGVEFVREGREKKGRFDR